MELARRVVRWAPRIAVVALLFAVLFGATISSQAGDGGGGTLFPVPNPPGGPLNDTTHDTTHPTFVQ